MSDNLFKYLKENGKSKYSKISHLITNKSQTDPSSEPFKSYYEARKMLEEMEKEVNDLFNKEKNDQIFRLLSIINLKLGVTFGEAEETSDGEKKLLKSKELIEKCEENKEKNYGIFQELYNQFGLVCFKRGKTVESFNYLIKSKKLYEDWKREDNLYPWICDDFFNIECYNEKIDPLLLKNRINQFEDNFTHSLYYLAQVCGKLEQNHESAAYCKETLSRQLDRSCYNVLDWSMNAATLAQYYLSEEDFSTARHCLASAQVILGEVGKREELEEKIKKIKIEEKEEEKKNEEENKIKEENEKKKEELEKIIKAWADLSRCWTKYSLALLEFSRDKLFEEVEKNNIIKSNSEKKEKKHEEKTEENIHFFNLEVSGAEGQVTCKRILIFDEAREIFLKTQEWIKNSKSFYVLDGYCSDYVEIIRDHSCLFKLTAFFEADLSRQCKMHKRRADMLVELLEQLNPQHYKDLCCQLAFEAGEVFSTMLDNKLALQEATPGDCVAMKVQASKKINLLANQGIQNFQKYLSFVMRPHDSLPSTLDESDERPVMLAYFYMGRMHSKIISPNSSIQLKNLANSKNCYQFIVDYCSRNPRAKEKVREERSACEEMVRLLPTRMEKIKLSIT